MGRARGIGRYRRTLGDRRHGPQWVAPAALCFDRRWIAVRRLRDRHGRARRIEDQTQGPRRSGPDDRHRSARGKILRRPRDQRSPGRRISLRGLDKEGRRSATYHRTRRRAAAVHRSQRAAAAADGGRSDHRGFGTDPSSHGGRRQRARRLDGRRHAPRRAFGQIPPVVALFPAELQPGHQSADRSAARRTRDEPEDALPQSRKRAGAGREADRSVCARKSGHLHRHVRAYERASGRALLRNRLRVCGRRRWPARGRIATSRRAHPRRGRRGGSAGLQSPDPDRRADIVRSRAGSDDPGDGRRAFPSRAARPQDLYVDQCAVCGMPGHPLFRGSDRRRRHHRQRLSGAGMHC